MKPNNSTSISRSFKWVTALSAIAISLLAFTTSAIAKDEVPQKGTETYKVIWSQNNPDGSVDTIREGVGVASHLGRYTVLRVSHALAPVYDPASNSVIIAFAFTQTTTVANGQKWNSAGEGEEIVPLDANFAPLPPPWAFSGTYQQDGGFVFQGTFQGFDFGDGTGSATWAGLTLSGGARKK